jgi:hypothetical protein
MEMTKEDGCRYLKIAALVALITVIFFAPKIAEIITAPHKAAPAPIPPKVIVQQEPKQFLQNYQITAVKNVGAGRVKSVALKNSSGETAELNFLPTDQAGCKLETGKMLFLSSNEIERHYQSFWVAICGTEGVIAHSFSDEVERVHFDPQTKAVLGTW